MRFFMLIILVSLLALTLSAVVERSEQQNEAAEALLGVDSGVEPSNRSVRQPRQFYGYYSRPPYGGYYGGYGHPYYGGYGFGRPYYGGYYRPYYGVYGSFYG